MQETDFKFPGNRTFPNFSTERVTLIFQEGGNARYTYDKGCK